MNTPSAESLSRAVASAGISYADHSQICKLAVTRQGDILDVGAGIGLLLGHLLKEVPLERLAGVDLLPRPDFMKESSWYSRDLNQDWQLGRQFETVLACQVVPCIENPWHFFRQLSECTTPGGRLILTIPNASSLKSFFPVLTQGGFAMRLAFPQSIVTAVLPFDAVQLCTDNGFSVQQVIYGRTGVLMHRLGLTWQMLSFGLLRGRLFSDEVTIIAEKVKPIPMHG